MLFQFIILGLLGLYAFALRIKGSANSATGHKLANLQDTSDLTSVEAQILAEVREHSAAGKNKKRGRKCGSTQEEASQKVTNSGYDVSGCFKSEVSDEMCCDFWYFGY